MSTLVENVQKVKNAHAALKTAIAAKGVDVPEGTKLTDMPALVEQISTEPVPTNPRAVFAFDDATSLVVPNTLVVDFSNATNLNSLFYSNTALTSIALPAGFGQNATNLGYCFYYCTALTSLTLPAGFGQKATTLEYCFYEFPLTSLTLPDRFGQNVTNLNGCFYSCQSLTSLTLPAGFGQNATNLNDCFYYCTALTSLTLPAGFGQKATTLEYCFYSCQSLTSLTLPAGFGSAATNIRRSFYTCVNLVDLHLPEGFGQNVIKPSFAQDAFAQCTKLTNITGNPNFKVSLSLSSCKNLTHDSLMVVINGLQTVTSTQTLKLGSTNLAKLTEADKKIATDKGWTLA